MQGRMVVQVQPVAGAAALEAALEADQEEAEEAAAVAVVEAGPVWLGLAKTSTAP